jgi:Mn2+/Fe2+ NRAMP family transporter
LLVAAVLIALGVHRARNCGLNIDERTTNFYWLIAVGVGLAVGVAAVVGTRIRPLRRLLLALLLGLVCGTGAYVVEALSWVGRCAG